MVKTPSFQCSGMSLVSGGGAMTPHASQCNQKEKKRRKGGRRDERKGIPANMMQGK